MRLRAAALSALAGAALVVPAAPAVAAACTQDEGVTVVVDFASLGGGAPTRCAPGDPSSGVAALRAAGFTPTRAAQEPGYFVCRIDGKPAADPCQRASPADAYWSYWHARPGGSWAYASTGAADYDPAPGTVDGWAFGAGRPPSSPPPRSAGQSASPPAARPSPTPSTGAAIAVPPHRAQPVPRTVAPSRPAGRPPSATATAPAARASPDAASAAAAAGPTAARPAAPSAGVPRPPAGVLAAAALVGLLAGATGAQLRRRRRTYGG